MPIFKGDVGIVLQCDSNIAFDSKSTKVIVTIATPSAKVLKRQGGVDHSRIYWNSENDLTEAGTYKISFEIIDSTGKYYTSDTFEVLDPFRLDDRLVYYKESSVLGPEMVALVKKLEEIKK
jgi:hypothetical protein